MTTLSDPGLLYSQEIEDELNEVAIANSKKYRTAQPFPHICIDNLLPEEAVEGVLARFPTPKELDWIKFSDHNQKKLAFAKVERLDPVIYGMLRFFTSTVALQFLEKLTGITGLITDPYFQGGGLHQIQPGGKLEVHADFNKLPRLRLDRRLNLILYLNKDWKEEYGGHLELWDTSMKSCVKRILPLFNRCVVFSTTDNSYHGHPHPLACPEGMSRKSLALYYYTNGRPEEEESAHHSTLFQTRPGKGETAKRFLRSLIPPIIMDRVRERQRARR